MKPGVMNIGNMKLFLGLILVIGFSFRDVFSANSWPPPPKWQDKALMARYLVHYGDWGIVSAISPDIGFAPVGTVQSYADGPMSNGTGIPYFYMATISDTWKNVNYNNTVSLSVSQAESEYCREKGLDPEEPLCSRITLTGKMIRVNQTSEVSFARNALFSRHSAMKNWPSGHDWNFYKLDPFAICLLDFYGGATHLSLKDYFHPSTSQELKYEQNIHL